MADRVLVNVLGLQVGDAGWSGPVLRAVRAPGQVLDVGCRRPSGGLTGPAFACGKPDGDGWLTRLRGIDRDDLLIASVSTT